MKKLLGIVFLLFSLSVYSQVTGTKFSPDKSYYKSRYTIQTGMSSWIYGYPNYYIKGDTTFSGKYYQKIYYQNKSVFDTVCLSYFGLAHYDNGRFYLNGNRIYDFSLVPGDTFNLSFGNTMNHPPGIYTYTVSVKDSVFIGSKWRKRLSLTNPPISGMVQMKWVDGIGDINYGFNCNYTTVELAFGTMQSATISCFSENFQNTYGTTCGIGICASAVIDIINLENDIVLFPNPSNGKVYLQNESVYLINSILIINSHGISKEIKYSPSETMDISDFPDGIYYLRIETSHGLFYKKIVIEK